MKRFPLIFLCVLYYYVSSTVVTCARQEYNKGERTTRREPTTTTFRTQPDSSRSFFFGSTITTMSVLSSLRGGGDNGLSSPAAAVEVSSSSSKKASSSGGTATTLSHDGRIVDGSSLPQQPVIMTTAVVDTTAFLLLRAVLSLGLGGVAGVVSWQFATNFPFWITPQAAKHALVPAQFSYDAEQSFFCNSAWTILTDYGLGVVCSCLAAKIFRSGPQQQQPPSPSLSSSSNNNNPSARKLRNLCTVLLLFYAVQFSVAGVLHQFLYTLEGRNTLLFRCFWTVVVTMVSASGGAIGAIGSELAKGLGIVSRFRFPCDIDLFWIGYTVLVVAITVAGKISCQRPAADTFFAGTSQALPTFFLVAVVALLPMGGSKQPGGESSSKYHQHDVAARVAIVPIFQRVRCILGFLLNAALLPGFCLAVYHTDTSLPTINTVMHSWLCLCYTLQGLSLGRIVETYAAGCRPIQAKPKIDGGDGVVSRANHEHAILRSKKKKKLH